MSRLFVVLGLLAALLAAGAVTTLLQRPEEPARAVRAAPEPTQPQTANGPNYPRVALHGPPGVVQAFPNHDNHLHVRIANPG